MSSDTHLAPGCEPASKWWMDTQTTPAEPFCPICSKPVTSGSLVLFQHGELFHLTCSSHEGQHRAMEQTDRAECVQARAVENVARAKELIEEAAGVPRKEFGTCGNCGQSIRAGCGYIRRSDGRPIHVICPRSE